MATEQAIQTKLPPSKTRSKAPSVFSLLEQYKVMILWLVILGIAANGLTLFLPKLISGVIDSFLKGVLNVPTLIFQFGGLSLGILIFTYIQSIVQTYASERVARDVRLQIVDKISRQGYRFIEDKNPSKLLTNITSDIDSIKMFVAQAVVSLVSSTVIIIGAAIILLTIDWRLALAVLTIIPIIGATFFVVLRLVRKLFTQSREVIDRLNKVINESIIGAALIRVLNSQEIEHEKFTGANAHARNIGMGILRLFSFMVPIITFVSSMGTLIVVTLGGYYVTNGSMTLGSFVAFNSYIAIFIFPILVIGFISNIIAQAGASYARIYEVLSAIDEKDEGTVQEPLLGKIDVKNVRVVYEEKSVLKDISLSIEPHTKTAIIGPTAAGKTQLLHVLTGLTLPQAGTVTYDDRPLAVYEHESFFPQIGLVFQDSALFNTTVRENVAFSTTVTDASLQKAIETAELIDFLNTLPQGLDTVVSERGASLSGGQKQRIMLARALALDPKILFLDDFTARVDADTERKILANIQKNYPGITLISITQKIAPIEHYDQIILLMEGEILARGTHDKLLSTSPEYVQIYESQRSTNTYELRT
ncbi:MAG TPA: ABC transporter ATP-binding protein [Candidatus Paceibacterota bacterium]|nr:ABC transporter ATP-binding protein [Candidatus Paceibacterota bacterium]